MDDLKNWYNNRKYGYLLKQCPIQSSLSIRSVKCKYLHGFNTLDCSLYNDISNRVKQSTENKEINNTNSLQWDSENVINKVLKSLHFQTNQSIDPKISIQDCIDDLNNYSFQGSDSSNIKQNDTKNDAKTTSMNISPIKPLKLEPVTTNNRTNKINPFETAKDKFIKEGGKVNSITESVDRINSKPVHSKEKDDEYSHLADKIEADIIHKGQEVRFDDIAGLDFAKKCVNELICWPMSRPDIFKGIRALPKGLLLFGPPGTGKTLIGKAISSQVGATFFSISASSLTSKWIGEGERTVRMLFIIASKRQPSVIFIDEIDSLLSQRTSDENEASRRIKTEFLVQLDGAGTNPDDRIVLIGATNRPDELDDAARRRFVKRIYIPLPDNAGRRQLLQTLLGQTNHNLNSNDIEQLVQQTAGFSGADIRSLCTEGAMGPVRDIAMKLNNNLASINLSDVPQISMKHFQDALESVSPSVSPSDLQKYIEWNDIYGSYKKIS